MALFRDIDCRLYKNTFLQSVLVMYSFEKKDLSFFDGGFNERFGKFLSENFGLVIDKDIKEAPISVKRGDGIVDYVFGNGFAGVKINARKYRSYGESVAPHTHNLKVFAKEVVGLEKVTSFSLRKINIWPFEAQKGEKIDVEALKSELLSEEILNSDLKPDNSINVAGAQKFEKDEKELKAVIRLVPMPVGADGTKVNFVVDIETILDPASGVELTDTGSKLRELNKTLYNAFHWTVSESVINLMKGE